MPFKQQLPTHEEEHEEEDTETHHINAEKHLDDDDHTALHPVLSVDPPSSSSPTAASPSPSPRSVALVYVCLLLAQACWSGFHVFAKGSFRYMPPPLLPALRSTLASPLLFAVCVATNGRSFWTQLSLHDAKLLLLLGTILFCGCQNLFALGLSLTSASDGGLTQPLVPVFAMCMSVAAGRERLNTGKAIGLALAVAGSASIVGGEINNEENQEATESSSPNITPLHRLMGIGCFMLQCLLFGIYLLIQKPLFDRLPSSTITFATFVAGIPGSWLIASFYVSSMQWSELPQSWYISIAYTVIFASVVAFLLYGYASAAVSPVVAAMAVTVQPLFSSLFGHVFLEEQLTWWHALGGVCLSAGLAAVVAAKQHEQPMQYQQERDGEKIDNEGEEQSLGHDTIELTSAHSLVSLPTSRVLPSGPHGYGRVPTALADHEEM